MIFFLRLPRGKRSDIRGLVIYMQKIQIPLKSPTCSTQVGTYMAEVLLVNEGEVLATEVWCVLAVLCLASLYGGPCC